MLFKPNSLWHAEIDGLTETAHPLLVDCDPICGGEPLVVLDVVDSVFQVAVPLGQVDLKQVPQQVLQITTEM